MISYGFPGVPARLNVRRVRLVAPFILVAMPLGWLLLLAAGDFHVPLGAAGALLYLAGFLASFLVIPTGVQRIAAGLPDGLDEMQLSVRLKAQSEAYRWFSLWIVLMAIALELVPPLTGLTITSDAPALGILFLWVIAWSIALPAFFLARSLDADVDQPEPA